MDARLGSRSARRHLREHGRQPGLAVNAEFRWPQPFHVAVLVATQEASWRFLLSHGRACPTAVRHIFCLMERTALILFSSRRLRINWTRKVNAVRHQNSVFHSLLKFVPWNIFDGFVEEHGADELVRKFKTRHQFIALLYGQFAGTATLRGIESAM